MLYIYIYVINIHDVASTYITFNFSDMISKIVFLIKHFNWLCGPYRKL